MSALRAGARDTPATFAVGLVATALCLCALAALVLTADLPGNLQAPSSKLQGARFDTGLLAVAVPGAVLLTCLAAWLFVRHLCTFLVLLVLSFALSEVLLPELNYASLFVRYTCMAVLTAGGLVQLLAGRASPGLVPLTGLLLLAWMLISAVLLSAVPAMSLTLLPAYCTMLVGIVAGMQQRLREPAEIASLNTALAISGVLLTLLHLSALALSSGAFLAGRFRSYYVLPTNFSNGYVLLVIAMLWYAMSGARVLSRVVVGGAALAGTVLVALSGTRNALAVAAICAVALALTARARVLYLGLVALALSVAAVWYLTGGSAAELGGRFADTSLSNRSGVWQLAWQTISARPIAGYGLGATSLVLENRVEAWERATYVNAHDAWLGIWLQLGLVGVVLLAVMFTVSLVRAVRLCLDRSRVRRADSAMVLLPAILLAGLAFAGIAEENLSGRGSLQQMVWALVVAAVNGSWLVRRANPVAGSQARGPILQGSENAA